MSLNASGFFGKLPAHGDFVRLRASEPLPRALVAWLEEGSETAKRQSAPCGAEPVRFLFHPVGEERALLGALTGSVDRVGRHFPLAVFAGVEAAAPFPSWPSAGRPFLEAVEALFVETARLDAPGLSARVEALPEVTSGEDRPWQERAAGEDGQGRLAALFGEQVAGQRFYAAHCARTACAGFRERSEGRGAIVLDCPVRDDLDLWMWLEVVRRSVAPSMGPSFFWRLGTSPRLLVALGGVPPSLFGLLWDAARRDAKLWPLTTRQPTAIEAARRALGADGVRALEREGASVLDLVAAFTGQA